MAITEIYKDTYFSAASKDIKFQVKIDDEAIYDGRAYARPNEENISVNIARICDKYLDSGLDDLSNGAHSMDNALVDFEIDTYDAETDTWSSAATFSFINCWDYEKNYNFNSNVTLSEPVNGHYAIGQKIFNTTYTKSTNKVATNISTQNVGNICGEYALYYLNRNGGWDSFLFEGICRKSDSYNISRYTKKADAGSIRFSSTRYFNQITEEWELNTGFLSDEEGRIFAKHLASTNRAYLHNLATDRLIPVNITNTEVQYKRFNDNPTSPEPVNYTITVEASQIQRVKY